MEGIEISKGHFRHVTTGGTFMKATRMVIAGLVLCILASAPVYAGIEWTLEKKIQLDRAPVDVATTLDGRTIFVLTPGEILLYTASNGEIIKTIPIEEGFDRLTLSPQGNTLIVTNSKEQTLKIIRIEQVYEINTSGLPHKGPENAPVTIVVFSDYQCPYCAKTATVVEQVIETNPEKVKLVFKNYPLAMHKSAKIAAIAALAANDQGKFWEFHKALFENAKDLNEDKIKEIAQQLGLDTEKFDKDLKDPAIEKTIAADVQEGRKIGVQGTPTVFVNGRLAKSRTVDGLQDMIDSDLNERETASASKTQNP